MPTAGQTTTRALGAEALGHASLIAAPAAPTPVTPTTRGRLARRLCAV